MKEVTTVSVTTVLVHSWRVSTNEVVVGWYASMTHPEHGPVAVALPAFAEDDGYTTEAFAPPIEVDILAEGDAIGRDRDGVNGAIECTCNEGKLERCEADLDGKALDEPSDLLTNGVDRRTAELWELVDNNDDKGAVESDELTSDEESDCAFTKIDCGLDDETAVDVVLSMSISHAFEHVHQVL
jgi:hypothetical protein